MEHTVDYYLKLLKGGYKESSEWGRETSKEEFLGFDIFGIDTCDDYMCEKMALEWLEVCECISENKTFEYISTDEKYETYLRTVNYKFFTDKLEYGTSIRGAWWDCGDYDSTDDRWTYKFKLETCGLWDDDKQVVSPVVDIVILTKAMRLFIEEK